jgi:alpha-ketoglutarate-dependent taurine dioxygenase
MTIKIKPYTEALGAEILNINLGRKLSDKNLSLIKDAINKYHVLFSFRNLIINLLILEKTLDRWKFIL